MKKLFPSMILAAASLWLVVSLLSGCAGVRRPLTLEERAQDVYSSLMCPLCAGQTIDQSQTELSTQMRGIVLEKLAQGASKEEILRFFVERYGEGVLAAPKKSGFSLLLWVVPGLAVVAGGFFLYRLIRNMQHRATIPQKASPAISDKEREFWEARLRKELEDRERMS